MQLERGALALFYRYMNVIYVPRTGLFWRLRLHASVVAGSVSKQDGYLRIGFGDNTEEYAEFHLGHRLAWFMVTGSWPEEEIDHEDTIRHHNQWTNLRPASHTNNIYNRQVQKNNTSGIKGVAWHKPRQKWRAYVFKDYKQQHIGLFDTKEEAASAVEIRQREMHKEFLNLNGRKI